jgi:1,4-dihydroxy-2-naphthoate polyprenyltransferase
MLHRSTIQLLRLPFSFFLMPVYWFALSMVPQVNLFKAILIFILLHLFLYPSSNGYNSYMDKDESSIGGIEHPMQPTKQLFYTTIVLDITAVLLSFIISVPFAIAFIIYIIFSRLYSYRKIRLKRFAVWGYLTVIINQGALTFWMVYNGANTNTTTPFPWIACIAAAFLIGGFYPITQVYQHEADARDGVQTISMLLGIRGTFVFCAIMYLIAFGLLFVHFQHTLQLVRFALLQIFFIPVLIYFFYWVIKVWKHRTAADFKHTMQMNWLAAGCTNLAFITLFILNYIG